MVSLYCNQHSSTKLLSLQTTDDFRRKILNEKGGNFILYMLYFKATQVINLIEKITRLPSKITHPHKGVRINLLSSFR